MLANVCNGFAEVSLVKHAIIHQFLGILGIHLFISPNREFSAMQLFFKVEYPHFLESGVMSDFPNEFPDVLRAAFDNVQPGGVSKQ